MKFRGRSVQMRSLPWYLESNFIKRIARLQRGPFKEPARAPMNLVAALHRSSCWLGLVRVVGPKLTALAASATFLSLLAYLLRLTAQVVQSEEVHRHVCAQHASTRDQTTACLFDFTKYFKQDKRNTILSQNVCYFFYVKHCYANVD